MMLLVLISLGLAAMPAALFVVNLFAYRPLRAAPKGAPSPTSVSVLIPARNEEQTIQAAVRAALAEAPRSTEIIVLDDHSTDATAEKVEALAAEDPRVRFLRGRPLPAGWCGKQHACWQLAQAARNPYLLFVDADVRLAPGAIPQLSRHLDAHPRVALLSGVPWQRTGTLLERMLIPLIHFVLLGFLPLPIARLSRWTAFAAGCGQLFLARRDAYFKSGGHQVLKASLHDGIKLPRAFRKAGFLTDLFDATAVAECRMYANAGEVWRGLGKNAIEGLAQPAAIGPWTVLLLGGQVMPWVLLALAPFLPHEWTAWAIAAAGLTLVPRVLGALRFRQSVLGILLHPISVVLLVVIQWIALARWLWGRPSEWRGRTYGAPDSAQPGAAISNSNA